ncbi:CocE/NonD family hydrolase [Kitasatospora sp. SUK 42]|uniref:CocE/NonD family hydrolase n=1 Tax=Kitasatospora sp. SUK 42 TaxID=1588882 RepID=UPI0018CAE82C|nr:CocE/NonD family hydrolase [Kitasatospora sp. SUK 42]MBV2155000.1 CocE/NonD family hydrolase [Kitasatospora sp. SUK 42]
MSRGRADRRTLRRASAAALSALTLLGLATAPSAAAPAAAAEPHLQSRYVTMPDGVRLAVDVYLPPGTEPGAKLPTVLVTQRYWRARVQPGKPGGTNGTAELWNARGYAYVAADLRGTGASFGTLTSELGADAIADSGSLSDWIAAQPWSNGRVGTTGISYGGDTAMLATALGNHHIAAAAPLSYDFDPYEDLVRPGGLLIEPRLAPYALLLRILDQAGGTTCDTDEATRQVCEHTGLIGLTPRPVDGPDGPALLTAARAEHANNANLVEMAHTGVHRDYQDGPKSWTVGSVGEKTDAIEDGGVPVLTRAGWLDAGTSNGVLSQFTGLSNTQDDWIGPWNHGSGWFADPFQPARPLTEAEHDQLDQRTFAFFDRYVRDGARPDGRRQVHYYTFNEGVWRTTTRWPVPGTHTRRLYLGQGNTLDGRRSEEEGLRSGSDLLRLDPTAGTGEFDRWNTNLNGGKVSYPDRAAVDAKLLGYTTAPLTEDTRVTGNGKVTLDVTGLAGSAEGALHVYLEDVAPDGRVTYLTEGQLAVADRAVSDRGDNPDWRRLRTPRTYAAADAEPLPQGRAQRVVIDLQPVSVLFRAGDRIRLSVAAANPDSFQLLPADGQASYRIGYGGGRASALELPVVG